MDLYPFLFSFLKHYPLERKVLAVTSKVISMAENRFVPKSSVEKKDLILKQSQAYLGSGLHGMELTISQNILIPSAGIDESNSENEDYILYPKHPYESAQKLYLALQTEFALTHFGVIITDSHSTPLRRGVVGIALAHWGIQATKSLIGKPDLFDRNLKFTHVNVIDSLASAAVLTMGEAAECTPMAVLECDKLEFTKTSSSKEITIPPSEDLYFSALKLLK